jgi:hypothetical protein
MRGEAPSLASKNKVEIANLETITQTDGFDMRALATIISFWAFLVCPASANWDTPFDEWRKLSVAYKAGYLTGFLEGNLNVTFVGDTSNIREHFKTCISFASNEVLAKAMDQTASTEPAMSSAPVAKVLVRTLFRICGGLNN